MLARTVMARGTIAARRWLAQYARRPRAALTSWSRRSRTRSAPGRAARADVRRPCARRRLSGRSCARKRRCMGSMCGATTATVCARIATFSAAISSAACLLETRLNTFGRAWFPQTHHASSSAPMPRRSWPPDGLSMTSRASSPIRCGFAGRRGGWWSTTRTVGHCARSRHPRGSILAGTRSRYVEAIDKARSPGAKIAELRVRCACWRHGRKTGRAPQHCECSDHALC